MGMMDELDTEIENAEAWVAETDDKIVGKVIRIDSRDGGFGEYPIATIEVTEGTLKGAPIEVPCTRSLHLMATVLMGEVGWSRDAGKWTDERTLFVGCTIGLKYLGKREGRTNTYDAWRCIVEPPPSMSAQLDVDQPTLFSK